MKKIHIIFLLIAIVLISFIGVKFYLYQNKTKIIFIQHSHKQAAKNYNVTNIERGSCLASAVSSRQNAWRCFAMNNNEMFDPCFRINKKQVICYRTPWNKKVTKLNVVKFLDSGNKPFDRKTAMPWGIKLADDSQCVRFGGATGAVDGQRVNYGCDAWSVLVGPIDKTGITWSINMKKGNNIQRVKIAAVWY